MKIIRDSIVYLAGDLISRSIPFLLLPYLTRTLGVEGFGTLSYYQVVIALGLIIIGFSQDGALTRYFYRYGKHGIGSLIFVSLVQATIIYIIATLIIALLSNDYIFLYAIMAAYSQSVLALFFASQQCQRRPGWYITIQLINAIISAGATVVLFSMFQANVSNRIIAMVVANVISLLFSVFVFYGVQRNGIKISLRLFRSIFSYNFSFGLPLLLHQVSFFAKGQIDRIFIYKMFSASALGVYSVGFQLASILAILLMALNKATVPYYYEHLRKGLLTKEKVVTYTHWSFLLIPIPVALYFFIPNKLYAFILGIGFEDAKYYALIFSLAISMTIPYLLLVNYFFYHGRNKTISLCTITSAFFYVAFVFLFSQYDIKYVPYSMVLSNVIMVAMLYFNLKRCKC